jgi:hypothetical protein
MACSRQADPAAEDGTAAQPEGDSERDSEGVIQDETEAGGETEGAIVEQSAGQAARNNGVQNRHAALLVPGERETKASQGTQHTLRFEQFSLWPWVS